MATSSLNNLAKLVSSLQRAKNGGGSERKSYVDPRLYKPVKNQDGTSQSIIRFIKPKNQDADPIVSYYAHKFDGQNGFYHENCPTTLEGGECPVCQSNRAAYLSKDEAAIAIAKKRVRKQKYIANIIVIKDGNTPENNGKVFMLEFDKKTFEKILARVAPPEGAVDEAVDIFSVTEGANFKYIGQEKTINLYGKDITFMSYDNSSFSDASPVPKTLLDTIKSDAFDISEFINPDKFKSYEILADRFDKVIGGVYAPKSQSSNSAPAGSVMTEDDDPIATAFDAPKAGKKKTAVEADPEDEDDLSDESFLKKLRGEK